MITIQQHIEQAHGGNLTAFARAVSASRPTVYSWIARGAMWHAGRVWNPVTPAVIRPYFERVIVNGRIVFQGLAGGAATLPEGHKLAPTAYEGAYILQHPSLRLFVCEKDDECEVRYEFYSTKEDHTNET